MNRFLRTLTVCLLGSAAACSSPDDDKVSITMFQATPDSIEAGQTAMLHVAINPPDAQVTISEVGDMTDRTEVPVHPTATTTYHLTAINGNAQAEATVTITVAPQPVVSLRVETASETSLAGESLGVTLTALSANGLPSPSFRGTIHLSSSDPAAIIPDDVSFGATDNGVKQTKLAFRTSGLAVLSAVDTTSPGRSAVAVVLVKPAAAASCTAVQAPTIAVAGSTVGTAVALHDPFGNLATSYAGTIRLMTTDARASVPSDVTYSAADAGSHTFSSVLLTAGPQALTAADTANAAIHCDAAVMITPAAPKIVLTMPGNAIAGYPVTVGVQVQDLFDNAIPNYAGTVTFTSSDSGAATPSPMTFAGGEGGLGSTSVSFLTRGTQVLSAHDSGAPVATGSAALAVVGLVYTAPTSGRVRLIANAAQSNAQVVQLDLVANERLEQSTFFGGGPGSFAVGMNLPLDTTRVGEDTPLLIRGNAIPVGGAGTAASAAHIGTDHVLYAGVARKRVPGAVFTQATEVQAGQVFYSVRLKLSGSATPGPVFDGAQPLAMFRASVRDQYGDDFVSQTDFGLGKLEVQ